MGSALLQAARGGGGGGGVSGPREPGPRVRAGNPPEGNPGGNPGNGCPDGHPRVRNGRKLRPGHFRFRSRSRNDLQRRRLQRRRRVSVGVRGRSLGVDVQRAHGCRFGAEGGREGAVPSGAHPHPLHPTPPHPTLPHPTHSTHPYTHHIHPPYPPLQIACANHSCAPTAALLFLGLRGRLSALQPLCAGDEARLRAALSVPLKLYSRCVLVVLLLLLCVAGVLLRFRS